MQPKGLKILMKRIKCFGDEATRRKYDRTYFAYKFKDDFSVESMKNKFNKLGKNDFVKMFFGGKNQKTVFTNFDKYYNDDIEIMGQDLESEINITLEDAFFGNEKKLAYKGENGKLKTIVVKIPRGIQNGEKIRISEQGKPGKNGGKNGDFYIRVNMLKHDIFSISGSDLIMDLPITPWEAVLGCNVEVKGIDSNVLINILPGTQTGEVLRVANAGYLSGNGNRGDLLLAIKIMTPGKLTSDEKDLFLKLKNVSTFNPRIH